MSGGGPHSASCFGNSANILPRLRSGTAPSKLYSECLLNVLLQVTFIAIMQRRSRGNDSGDDGHRHDEASSQNSQHSRRKRRRNADDILTAAAPAESVNDIDARSTVVSSISILLEPNSSPATVLNAILDIKRLSNFSTFRSLIISSGCIPPLLQWLGVGLNDTDEHILHVVSALCKDNSEIRQQFRTPAFIKKAVALAIPALGNSASSSPIAKSARFILKSLSDSSTDDYDSKLLNEQQQRLDDLKEVFMMSQTTSSISREASDGSCESCSVCLESFDHVVSSGQSCEASPRSCSLPCKHIFHSACISKWFSKHANCPVCRFKLVEPPRTPPILSSITNLPFSLSMLLGLGSFGGAGGAISFGFPASITPSGMNFVFVSFRSGNGPPDS